MLSLSGPVLLWIAALVVFLVVEAVSVGLVSIWFAAGALAALICALLRGPVWLQVLWFVVVSAATLVATRPLVKKFVGNRSVATNADRNIGRTVLVTERIDDLASTGAVKLDGVTWTARSLGGEIIEAGRTVIVRDIQGVKLIVSPSEAGTGES